VREGLAPLIGVVIFIVVIEILGWSRLMLMVDTSFNVLLADHSLLNIHEVIQINVLLLLKGRNIIMVVAFNHIEEVLAPSLKVIQVVFD